MGTDVTPSLITTPGFTCSLRLSPFYRKCEALETVRRDFERKLAAFS